MAAAAVERVPFSNTMSLPPLAGHSETRELLGRSHQAGSLPQSILLHGPRGVGKERLGLWLAQLIVCEVDGAEPCGRCSPCLLTLRLEHPDVHWFFPLPRPSSSSADKLKEKLEDARAEEIQHWRENPFHQPAFDKAPAHFVAAIRSLNGLATMRPAMGNRKVFVVGDAELMVPQESSPEAANAFLKLLEEPPTGTTLIITSSQPGALLPTIRSRVLSVRVGPVGREQIAGMLAGFPGLETADAEGIAGRARGSTGRAIQLAADRTEGGGAAEAERKAARELLLAALSTSAVARLGEAHDRRPAGARNTLVGELEALAEWLRDLLAVSTGATENVSDSSIVPILSRMVRQRAVTPAGAMRALDRVDTARDLALGNVNPQLIVAGLLADMQRDFEATAGANR